MNRSRKPPVFWLFTLVASIVAGLIYERLFATGRPFIAGVYGVFMGAPLIALESGWLLPQLRQRLRAMNTLVALPTSQLIYVALITSGHAVAGGLLWAIGLESGLLRDAALPTGRVLLYALVASAIVISVLRVRDLIGSQVFVSLLIGRYHKPITEQRVFLFIDVVGSTRFAEAQGDLRAQEFLAAFFAVLAAPVRSHRGSIDDYVGDMALITWPLSRGVQNSRCVACVFAVQDTILQAASAWQERFGRVPHFRAALHAGTVVTAEVGVDRHKISYFGDTVNVTARIETLCKELDAPVLISSNLLEQLTALPENVVAQSMGEHVVHGRLAPLGVSALVRRDPSQQLAAQ